MTKVPPLVFGKFFWPHVEFYDKQREIIESVARDDETYAPAGNQLGKDFVAAFIALEFFLTNQPARVITTSVKDDHLDVLWGEIDRFLRDSRYPLLADKGGYLVYNHHEIRKVDKNGVLDRYSYLKGQVSKKGEGMSGHHAPNTLLIVDEASGVDDMVYDMGIAWAKRILVIGNPNPCTNFFWRGVKAGNLKAKEGGYYHRRVITITAFDSPNVKFGEAQKRQGKIPNNEDIVPGVIGYKEYWRRRALWDPVRQTIGLDAEFPEDSTVLMYPPDWLRRSAAIVGQIQARVGRNFIGIDPAEGGDDTVWCVINDTGILDLVVKRTTDTSIITGDTIALMRQWSVDPNNVVFDAGGGGKQHADRLRQQGYKVKAVAFGGAPTAERTRTLTPIAARRLQDETRLIYKNRRAEMYGILRERLNPVSDPGFAIPERGEEYTELRRQLSMIPLTYDEEGRLKILPKDKRTSTSTEQTLKEILGRSPDHLDALVLASFAMWRPTHRFKITSR